MTIEWGPIREHDGSAECPAEARDVPCMIYNPDGIWLGGVYGVKGKEWLWETVTAYRLPADVPAQAPAADPVRDALGEHLAAIEAQLTANEGYFSGNDLVTLQILQQHITDRIAKIRSLAKGEKQ